MPAIELTTLARVKAVISKSKTDEDALITTWISMVSNEVERFLGRWTEQKERTEDYDAVEYQMLVHLAGYPVDDGQTFELSNDISRTFGTDSQLDTTAYYLNARTGKVELINQEFNHGPGAIRVKYTGGMAVNTAALIVAFPDIAGAVDLQIAHLYQKHKHLGATSVAGDGGRTSSDSAYDWLPSVERILKQNMRMIGRRGGPN